MSMKLIRYHLNIVFESPSRPWDELRSLLRAASADADAQMQAAPMIIERKKDKTLIVIQVRAINLVKEPIDSDISEVAADARSEMLRLHEASPFPTLELIQSEAIFIEPFDMPFHALVDKMRSQFLTPTRSATQSTDLGLVFDQRDGYLLKRANIGPMDKTQLQTEVLKWPRDDAPDTFVFASLRYDNSEVREFSENLLAEFLEQASEWQEAEADLLANELTETGR